jgi:hypothetical protein
MRKKKSISSCSERFKALNEYKTDIYKHSEAVLVIGVYENLKETPGCQRQVQVLPV